MFTNVKLTELPNGIRVVSSAIDHVQSVATGIWIKVGARYESPAVGGVSHFLEHLLFKGTPKRSALEISRAIEGRGGYLNAFTQEESTCYYARVGYDHVARAFDVLADMVLNACCSAEDVEKERQVILEEMLMYRDQPHHVVQELLQEAVWPGHPLGRPVIGDEASIGGITSEAVLAFRNCCYVPPAIVAAFAGKVDHDRCVDQVAGAFAAMGRRPAPKAVRFNGSRRQDRCHTLAREIEQTHLALGFRLFGRQDPQRYRLKVLNTILGENMSSRLFQTVRERHGLAYSIHSSMQLFEETGMLNISAGLDRKRSTKALTLILKEIDRFRQKPVTANELKRAKDYLVGQLRLGLENTSHQMMWIGDNIISFGRFIDPNEAIEATRRTTAADVMELARQFFKRDRMSVALVTPLNDAMTSEVASAAVDRF